MRLLIVEDDAMFANALGVALAQEGIEACVARDLTSARLKLLDLAFDAVLLDLGLPRGSGLDLLRHLRGAHDGTPVIVISARDALSDRITALDLGADDYLVKPFQFRELQARMRAVMRRTNGTVTSLLVWENLTLDPASHVLLVGKTRLQLSEYESRTLFVLLRHAGRTVSRAELETHLYAGGRAGLSNTVAVFVHALRRKIGADVIETVRGLGYRLRKEAR